MNDYRPTPYQLDESAKVADRLGRKLDAQWFRDRAQAQREGRPEPADSTPHQRIAEHLPRCGQSCSVHGGSRS